jgi:outer membrane protein OmpA-like peptidoglycan-associated protein
MTMRHVIRRLAVALLLVSRVAPVASQAQSNGSANPPSPVLVFFDWGKPVIGSDAAASLDAVAASFLATPALHLNVSGHSDRSGGAPGNRRSSLQRAAAVADYLAGRGVPRSTMTIAGYGEDRPLIPTADGVREPQNRRVEVSFAPAPER